MKIYNIRVGFATNSSSSHSIIVVDPKLIEETKDICPSDKEFGWQDFVLISKKSKESYLALLLKKSISYIYEFLDFENKMTECESNLLKKMYGLNVKSLKIDSGYVDHSSVIYFPKNYYSKSMIDDEFFEDFKKFIIRKDVIILGGNDNTSKYEENILYKKGKLFENLEGLKFYTDYTCRKDEKYDYWSLFDRKDGTKIRFSFYDNKKIPDKAFAPELVDMKITDYCESNCPYCYMDSKKSGKHADEDYIIEIIKALSSLKVFEVAIGGGDPTKHPNFLYILEECRNHGIIPNFSTKNYNILNNKKELKKYLKLCGKMAFSVSCIDETDMLIDKIDNIIKNKNTDYDLKRYLDSKISFHMIPGVSFKNKKELNYIFDKIKLSRQDFSVTLLGYKNTGRAKKYSSYKEYKTFFNDLCIYLSKNYFPISIDTEIAKKNKEILDLYKVPKWLYFTEEGKFSAYIDAVNNEIGPSSFCNDNEKKILKQRCAQELKDEIIDRFSEF